MKDSPEIMAARADVDRTRSRVMTSAHDLQERLSPKSLARSSWEGAKEKGADLAVTTVDAVRARPLAATGIVAMVTMFLAREPLMALAGKAVGKSKKPSRSGRKAKVDQTETAQ